LADHVIHRHYPELAEVPELQGPEQLYPALLCRVIEQQARLIAAWMNVGFVHGVMNTDNMTISGETIDYGPCAFMDHYDPGTVFSSIDHNGRYSFGNQPAIAHWNLTRFAETLLPLIHPDEKTAIESVHPILDRFASEFSDHWRKGMRSKLGLFESKPEDESLIDDLLQWMQKNKIDFTNAFRSLTLGHEILSSDPAAWKDWRTRWENRQSLEGRPSHEVRTLMQQSNPQLIPRNHHVEHALQAAVKQNDLKPFEALLEALQHPFENRSEHLPYLDPGPIDGEPYQTYCGT
jgi:uncharacterized protein YdiU (UPF0061 family)